VCVLWQVISFSSGVFERRIYQNVIQIAPDNNAQVGTDFCFVVFCFVCVILKSPAQRLAVHMRLARPSLVMIA
jgi:hypothetical protein